MTTPTKRKPRAAEAAAAMAAGARRYKSGRPVAEPKPKRPRSGGTAAIVPRAAQGKRIGAADWAALRRYIVKCYGAGIHPATEDHGVILRVLAPILTAPRKRGPKPIKDKPIGSDERDRQTARMMAWVIDIQNQLDAKDAKSPSDAINRTCANFNVSSSTVYRAWTRCKDEAPLWVEAFGGRHLYRKSPRMQMVEVIHGLRVWRSALR